MCRLSALPPHINTPRLAGLSLLSPLVASTHQNRLSSSLCLRLYKNLRISTSCSSHFKVPGIHRHGPLLCMAISIKPLLRHSSSFLNTQPVSLQRPWDVGTCLQFLKHVLCSTMPFALLETGGTHNHGLLPWFHDLYNVTVSALCFLHQHRRRVLSKMQRDGRMSAAFQMFKPQSYVLRFSEIAAGVYNVSVGRLLATPTPIVLDYQNTKLAIVCLCRQRFRNFMG